MFTGFPTENIPGIQVWDFSNFLSTSISPKIYLTDDCAPIQYFMTGADTAAISVYLPTAPIEGRLITIVNTCFSFFSQFINVYSSDTSGTGSSATIYSGIGPGQTLRLVYSKQFIRPQGSGASGAASTGWASLDMGASSSLNYWCAVIGGSNNAARTSNGGRTAVIGGDSNSATNGYAAVVGGQSNSASSTFSSVLGGSSNSASNTLAAVIGGTSNAANAANSIVIGGSHGTTRSITGNFISPASTAPITGIVGTSQIGKLLLAVQTTDATPTVLRSNNSAAATTNQVTLPNNSAYYFRGELIAGVTGGGNTKGWFIEGAIKRGANAASTALVGTPTVTSNYADAGAAAWTVAVTADTTNGAIAVTVTGAAATTIRWVCQLRTTEMTY